MMVIVPVGRTISDLLGIKRKSSRHPCCPHLINVPIHRLQYGKFSFGRIDFVMDHIRVNLSIINFKGENII